jgi:hypothetical protein
MDYIPSIPPSLRGAFDQRLQTLGGERWPAGRWRCDANNPTAVQAAWSRRASRTSLGRSARVRVVQRQRPEYHGFRAGGCRSRRMKAPQRWIGFPCVRGSLKRFVHRGPCGANLKHRARDAGKPAHRGDYACASKLTLRTGLRGAWRPGVPRALVSGARVGNANLEYGLPGAAQEYGRRSVG